MMVYYTLTQAAAATGKHKSTILRALQADKISSTKDVHGGYKIEAEGLHAIYPRVAQPVAEPLRTDSAPVANATESSATSRNDAAPLHNVAEPLRTSAEQEKLEALNEQQAGQVEDLRSTIADLQARLDAAEADRRQLEADRRLAGENSTRQIDQLSQLLAMKEKAMQTMQLEHQQPETDRGWLGRLFQA